MWCLPKQYLESIKKAIADGVFITDNLNGDSATRRAMFETIVGKDNAEQLNTMYEKQLILQPQETAIYKTLKEATGLNAKAKADIAEKTRLRMEERNRRLYDPNDDEPMLNEVTSDIYSKKYGTDVSLEDAQRITELASEAKEAKNALLASKEDGLWPEKVALDNFVNAMKIDALKESGEGKLVNPLKAEGVSGKTQAVWENFKVSTNFIASNARAVVASLDNSFWFRQGLKSAFDPRTAKTWWTDFGKSWGGIGSVLKGEIGEASVGDILKGKDAIKAGDALMDAVKAEIYGRQDFLLGRYQGKVSPGKGGISLDINTGEEAYPTSSPSQIPILGRFFKGSEVAYEVGAMRLRADLASHAYRMAEKAGVDLNDNQQLGDINKYVNSITGRGSWGKGAGPFEKVANLAFFSLKNIKSQVDYITSVPRYLADTDSYGKRMAATNFLYGVATTAVILEIAKTLNPDDNKDIYNTTSANFGKIKVGHMTFDLTGGYGSLVVLMGKIFSQASTSAVTGIKKPLGPNVGAQTGMDVLWSFTENKSSPMASLIRDMIKQKTFQGGKPTIAGEAAGLITPITIANISQFKSEPVLMQFLGLIADSMGINTNVVLPTADWADSASKEMQQFHKKVGDDGVKEATDLFNQRFNDWFDKARLKPSYEKLTDDQKSEVITQKKAELKEKIFRKYSFVYRPERQKPLPKL